VGLRLHFLINIEKDERRIHDMIKVNDKTFYKVLLIHCDVFESTIVDERHFSSKEEAETFISGKKAPDQLGLIVQM
jgi:hypothetical protein